MNVKDLKDLFGEDVLVKEPEHSLQVLLEYQEKYGISSDGFFVFYRKHSAAPVEISPRELARWEHHYEIFKMAGGAARALKERSRNPGGDNFAGAG